MFEGVRASFRARNGMKVPFANLISSGRNLLDHLFEDKKMGGDLLFMSTYMASITTSGVTRPEIFEFTASRRGFVPVKYIERVQSYVKRWNYSYVEALTIVADKIHNEMLRSMMNRYANSIKSGIPDEEFLNKELGGMRSTYRNTYEQGLEMIKKWGDAYVAMLFSASLIGIIIMISVAIYAPEGIESTLNMSYLTILLISICGLSIMYKSVPDDERTHHMKEWRSKEQGIIRKMELVILPLIAVVVILLVFLGGTVGMIFLLIGVLLAPLGIIGYIDDSNIIRRDLDFATFIRGLGAVMGGKEIPTMSALADLDRDSLPNIKHLIDATYSRLNLGLDEKKCWERFTGESGSSLINKYMNIFRDAVELGGKPNEIGQIVSSSVLEQVLLRQKRNMFSKGFIVLLVPMHAAMVGIFLFLFHVMLMMSDAISTIIRGFGETQSTLAGTSMSGAAMRGMNLFVNFPEAEMTTYIIIIIVMITVSNILAAKIVDGGDRYMFYLFTSLLCVISGLIYIIAPVIVHAFFTIPVIGGA